MLVLAFAAAAAGAAAYVFVQSDRDGRAQAERDARFAARTTAEQLGEAVTLLRATVENLAATPGLAAAFERPEDCALTFGGAGGVDAGHVDVLRDDGRVACTSREEKDGDYGGDAWLERAREGPVFEAPVPDKVAGGHAALAAAPFDGGVVVAFLALEPAGATLADLYGGGHPIDLLVTTADGGAVIARSTGAERWVGRSIADTPFARAAGTVDRPDLDGRPRLYAQTVVPDAGWRLYVGEDREAALAAGNRLRNRQLAIILVGFALVLVATLFVYRRVALPVTRLSAEVRATSELSPPRPVRVSGPAEVAELGEDVNGLIAAVARELEERARAEHNYRLLFESGTVPMWIYDLDDGIMLEVNDAALEAYGYGRDEFLALTMADLQVADTPDRQRHRLKDGTEIAVHTIDHIVDFGGREARFVAAEDVGERDRLEEQLRQAQRMEAIGRLAGGIAHDFNNILAAVVGYSELLLAKTPAGDPRRAQAEQIKNAGERAAALTRQLLTLGRRQAVEPVVLDVDDVVVALEPMLRRLIRADVELVISGAGQPTRVRADRSQLEQVLVNLAVNAGDAMAVGGGRLTIATEHVTLDEAYFRLHPVAAGEPGPHVVLDVSDTGVGIDDVTMSRIFEPFFTTKPPEQGTGLGLATVYGIVRQSGGFVWAYSEVGRGTTFKVYLPAVEAPVALSGEPGPETVPATSGRTVLLVEDDAAVRAVVRLMLEAHGLTILEAGEGGAALRLSEEAEPGELHLLVTDTVLPGPGGSELAARVRARHPRLPTLMMSGYSDAVAIRDGPLDPGVEFIAKPFTQADLSAKLAVLLGRAGA
ncbi:MAG TPA: ATP-binding protein [Solirubrobacteraceae bacterium]|nr:ATP-binding protein [Solirubrobacteraceae bacterium]